MVCFDEHPCFLISDIVEALDMEAGKVAKQDYAYSKHGSFCILETIEPSTGKRLAHVRKKVRKKNLLVRIKLAVEENLKLYSTDNS